MPLLVLAGKMGHQSEPIRILVDRDQPPVLILEHLDDQSLEYLYTHSQFTIFPSLLEGWGLPVGESLWFGKPCLASRASSIPEVGGRYVTYFDPTSCEDIKDKIRLSLDAKCDARPPDRTALRTWRDVAFDFLNTLQSEQKQQL